MKKEEVNRQIKEVVRPNGKGEINGNNLQETLLLMNNNAANDEDTTSKLNLKANQEETDEKLALKADKTSVYTKEEANALLDLKVNIKDYEADKEVSSKEKQELDIKLAQTKQELDSVKSSLSHMGNGVVGEAKGGSVINLPNNAMKSVVPNYRIEGLTLTNLVKNGDFRDGTSGWRIWKAKSMEITESGLLVKSDEKYSTNQVFRETEYIESGDLYYSIAYINNIKNVSEIALSKSDLAWSYFFDKKIIDNETSVVLSGVSSLVKPISRVGFIEFRNKDGLVGEITINRVSLINLTQIFGAGNEPSKEWCDANLPDYVEGTKSVQLPMRVKSVGENLFDYNIFNKFKANYTKVSGLSISVGTTSMHASMFQDVVGSSSNKNPKRLIKVRANQELYLYYKSEDKNISCSSHNNKGEYIESIYELKRNQYNKLMSYPYDWLLDIRFREGNTTIKDLQIVNYNKDDSDYIPYQESLAYFNDEIELSSVTTTKDYIENDKLYKNIKRYYFSKEDEWTLREDYTGDNFRYYMILPFNYKATGAGVEGELFCNNFTPTSNVESALTERDSNTIALYKENASTLYLTLNKNVTDVNSEIPEGTFIDVILPQTEVVNLNTSGLIEANPNGTVFFEPITNLTGFYDNGLDVEGLGILEVEEFSHLINGVYQSLDVSKVKVEGGKLTHPDAQKGIVYLVYRYDNNSVWGENTISYYNSDKTLKSPNGKIWKKVESATDTGELVVTLEEVTEEIVEP